MKKTTIGFVALFLMLFGFSFALAENDTLDSSLVSNETPMLISAQVDVELDNVSEKEATGNLFWKKLDIWFTFNQEKKAEKELKLAEFQLVRARVAARNNNTKAMENALEAHKQLIERVQERVSKIENGNASEKLIGLDRAIQVHQARIARFNAQLNNSNLSAGQIEKLQERIGQAQENTDHLREVANERRLEFEKRFRERNVSDDDSNNENETEDDDSLDDLNDDSNESEDSSDSNKTDDDSEDDASGTVLSGRGQSGNANN
jgi:hypothetical protein